MRPRLLLARCVVLATCVLLATSLAHSAATTGDAASAATAPDDPAKGEAPDPIAGGEGSAAGASTTRQGAEGDAGVPDGGERSGGATQPELVREAQLAEQRADPARAAELYRRALDADPTSRLARRARTRLSFIEARKAGGYEPLAALMQARRTALDRSELERFEKQVRKFPRGLVRREARALIAQAYLGRLHDPHRAIEAHQAWLAEPDLSSAERQLAVTGLARARRKMGDLDGALRVLREANMLDRPEAQALAAQAIRRVARPVAYGLLAGFAVLTLAFGGWRGFAPAKLARALGVRRLAFGAYVLGVPLLFAWLHSHAVLSVVGRAVLGSGGVALLASVAGVGIAASRIARWRQSTLVGVALLAQLAALYLALDRSDHLLALLISLSGR